MTKTERITKLMELLQASIDGKEIEQCDCGHWYSSKVEFANVQTVHQFRVKPNVVTKKYRVGLFTPVQGLSALIVCGDDVSANDAEGYHGFIRWLTPWTEYTVEQ